MQWNIWAKEKPENIANFLQKNDADIICAQEIVKDSRIGLDAAKYIAQILSFEHCYQDGDTWNNRQDKEAQGNAIFSRFPIIKSDHYYVQDPKHNPPDSSHEGRVYVEALVKVGNKKLIIGTTHLSHSNGHIITRSRKREADILLGILKKKKGDYVFAADLNSTPESYPVKKIEKILLHSGPDYSQKTWTTKPSDPKNPAEKKLNLRLDYIYASKDIKVMSSEILECPYSDHLPILIKFEI